MTRLLGLAALCLASAVAAAQTSVGMTGSVEELVLPGPRLEVAPFDRSSPIVLRLRSASPHGTAWRYDLEYVGLEPGSFDLSDYLRPADGAEAVDLPPVEVTVAASLPPGQVLPHAPGGEAVPAPGGYRTWIVAGVVVWIVGLVVILAKLSERSPARGGGPRTVSAADRLRPLVESAVAGELSSADRARLERLLLRFWQRKLELEDRPERVLATLREHAEAGPLLRGLEDWLHRPVPPADLDLERLLEPYRHVSSAALDAEPVAAGGAA